MNNFTPRAQQALALARKEADRFNHYFVGTEHLLLGLIRLGQGVAVNVLQRLGLDLETVRLEVEKQVSTRPDEKNIGHIPYTPRVKKVLSLAAKEAKNLNHTYVGTEHILLGLLLEADGVAARVLSNLQMNLEKTRHEILNELDPNFEPPIRRETPRRSANIPSSTGTSQGPAEFTPSFTPQAQQVLRLAKEEADRLKHIFVGTEHLFLGLIGLGQGVAVNVLQKLGIELETVRMEIERHLPTAFYQQKTIGDIPYTPRVKKVLALAATEAKDLHQIYIGTEHILLGLLREGDGMPARTLKNLGLDFQQVRQEVLKELGPNAGS